LNDCKYFYKYLSEKETEYNILHLVCPRACTYKTDAVFNVETDFDSALEDVDTVIISDITKMPWIYKDTVNKIVNCLENGYRIICCTKLEENDLEKCKNTADTGKFVYLGFVPYKDEYSLSSLRSINGIVIGIGMLSSGIEYNDTFFNLFHLFRERRYTVAGICERYDAQLIKGCYPFPSNIFEKNITDQEKVLQLNDYINTIQMKHSADIILLCFPKAMLKFSDEVPDGFGINSYMISQAVSVDYFILNKPLIFYNPEGLISLNNTFAERFGFNINAIGIDNKVVNYSDSKELERMVYNRADINEVNEEVEKCQSLENGILFFSVSDESFYETIVSDCIDDLSGDVELY
jgi:hypothetical protein